MVGAETLSRLNWLSAPVVVVELACVWDKRGKSKGKSCMSTAVSFMDVDSTGTKIGLLDEVAERHCCLGGSRCFRRVKKSVFMNVPLPPEQEG
jgi:hypothetical protein